MPKPKALLYDAPLLHRSVPTAAELRGIAIKELNLDPLMPEINKHYDVKEGKEKYPRGAMIKAMIFKRIRQIKYYTKAASYLKENPIDAMELGFNIDKSGNVILPDHETLRHYEKVRLGNEGMVIAQYYVGFTEAFWAIRTDNRVISLFPEKISLM
jgi:hypothetical protein